MTKLYSKDSTNPYGFAGLGGAAPGRHRVSRFDKQTPSERNRIEEILTEVRNELTTQIDDTTSIHQAITYKVFVPETRTNVINSTYVPFEFRGVGQYQPSYSLDGPVLMHYAGFINRVIVHRKTPGSDGSTVVDVKIDGTSILQDMISIPYTDSTALVVDNFTSTFYSENTRLTVDIVEVEDDAEDLLVVVEVGYPFKTDIFTADYVQYGVPYYVDNLDGIWICPFEADWKYWRAEVDTTASGSYVVYVHHIDSTTSLNGSFNAPGFGGGSVNSVFTRPGDKFAVSIGDYSIPGLPVGIPDTEDTMNLRVTLTFDRRTLNYKSIMNFIAGGMYEEATAWDVPRYIPETCTINDLFLSRGTAGLDGSTVVSVKSNGTEIARLSIDSSTTYYDSTTCHVSPNAVVPAGSYLTFDILETDSPSGTGPSDLRCMVVYEKNIPTNPTTFADSTETSALRGEVARLDSTVSTVSSTVVRLDSTVANILQDMTALDSTTTGLLASVVRLDSTVAEVKSKVASIDATVGTIASALATLNTNFTSLNTAFGYTDSTVAGIYGTLQNIDSTVSEVALAQIVTDSTVAELSTALTSAESDIDTLQAGVAALALDATCEHRKYRVMSSNQVVSLRDSVILANAAGGTFSVALPPAASANGRVYYVKKTDSSATIVHIDGDGVETVDGSPTYQLTQQYQGAAVISDSTQWFVISSYL